MFYGRPYWNLSDTKRAMENVPGYNEREFDDDLGIQPTYDGDGVTVGYNLKSLISGLKIITRNKKQRQRRLTHNAEYQAKLLTIYKARLDAVSADEAAWRQLVFKDYLFSESTYFEQIFINQVAQSIYKDTLLKQVSKEDYLKLLMGLNDVSHLRPYQAMWRLSHQKKVTKADLDAFIDEFGYHSDKELDVTYPHYAEDSARIKQMIAEVAKLPDIDDPVLQHETQERLFQQVLQKLSAKARRSVAEMRQSLWWREEFRDVSTRFYYLIRLYTLELAKSYTKSGLINVVDDIWFLKINDIRSFMDGEISKRELRKIIIKNRDYYDSFRHFLSENEIGRAFDGVQNQKSVADGILNGIGCSAGIVTATARVVADLSEIDTIKPGEILVTKFTDTGWTSKFAIISGIVTEYGGVLCHAAIVSREFGIPCVVSAKGAMNSIKTGDVITIDGATGLIRRGS
jgi:pyruvate,water dikinase